jgi:hypothetical protein
MQPQGCSLIAPPLSMAFGRCPGDTSSLRGRNNPPQHLVRSTCAAMSTTSWHSMTPLKALSRSHPYPRPAGNHCIRDFVRMSLRARRSGGGCGLRPAEWLPRRSDIMQNNEELSGQSHTRFAISRSLCDCSRPILQSRSFFDPRQDHDSSLIQQSTGQRVAALRYPAATIDFPRLILSWCEFEVRPYRSRPAKAPGILNYADIRE